MKIAIYIPAYNAAGTLPGVLDRIPRSVRDEVEEIIVVDNASTDNTGEVVLQYRHDSGLSKISLLTNAGNLGYGGSQKRAYRYAIEKGYQAVVMLHSDGQYDPQRIDYILEPIVKGEADAVSGSRLAGDPVAGGMPLNRYLGNKMLTALTNQVLGWSLSEYHSGYRAYRCDALAQVPFERCADYYHFDVDIFIQFSIKGLKVVERPIDTHYGSEECHQNTWRTGISILKLLSDYLLHRSGLRRSYRYDFT